MQDAASTLPPLRAIASALRTTTETLAGELACPTDLPPHWSDLEWRVAPAAAAMHGVSALLSSALRWCGPQHWEQFLSEQRLHTVKRHFRILQVLDDLNTRAHSAGVALIALKGAALHAVGLYPLGERPMADIDLLVRENDFDAARRVLEQLGYRYVYATARHWVFEPSDSAPCAEFGEHAANPIKIELHTRVMERLPVAVVDMTERLLAQEMHAGLNRYPSTGALMLHLLLHAAGNMCNRGLRLVQLHDIAALAPSLSAEDWDAVVRAPDLWWTSPPLLMTARYYPTAIPWSVATAADARCPTLLRRFCRSHALADVSWSNLRIQALPGIEWSRSVSEMLQFAVHRVRPSAQAVAERRTVARTQPGTPRSQWGEASQGKRILHWVLRRPPRMETIASVRAALLHKSV